MKRRKVILRCILIVAALAAATFLVMLALGNQVYWSDVRGDATAWPSYENDLAVTEQGVRFEKTFFDNTTAFVVFDRARQVVAAEGFAPIDFDRKNFWGLWTYDDFLESYGESHFYIGNSSEAWITDDGYVIALWMPGERFYPFPLQATPLAGEVTVYDLLKQP